MGEYLRLTKFLLKIPKEVCIKIGIGLAIVACSFLQAFCLAKGVASVFAGRELQLTFSYLLICLLALLLRCLLIRYQEGYVKQMSARVKAVIRKEMLQKLMSLGPAYRNDKRTGKLQSLITDGIESFEPFLVQYIPQTVVVLVSTLCSCIYLWRLDSSVGMLILFMSVISVLIPHLFMPAVSKVMIEYWQDYADLNAQYIDSMQGMSTLKSLGVSKREGEKLADRAWGFQRESMKNLGISLSDSAVIVACTTIGTAVGIALAAWHMACGKLTYETLLVILFLAGETMKPLNEMNTYWHSSYLGLSVAEELFALLDEPQVLIEGKRYCRLDATVPGMCLQNVFFSYTEKGGKVLKNVTMEMYAGKITALVGKSGSGKSTIVSLLLRFFDAEEGTVMLDGKDVRDFPIEYLRNQISVVFQEPYIFYGTIRENLRMAKPDATDEELTEAAKLANAHEFIMEFQDGYDTLVGERGATLSGGERQRIAIARAILKAAPILILDEATSSVDMVHEAKIQEALNHCMKGKTTIVIAHRLSTIEHADVIYVLEEGCVTGKGTHEELLKGNQVYRRLIEAQKYA